MNNVLITGAAGFVGSNLYRACLGEYDHVVGTTRRPIEGLVECDVTSLDNVEAVVHSANPDVIFHCAAISNPVHSSSLQCYDVNALGTKNIVSAIRSLGKDVRLIYLSTAGVYGNHPQEMLTEDLSPRPVHDYGMSKLCGEFWALQSRDVCKVTVVRPFNIVGPGQEGGFIVPKLAKAFASGARNIRLGNIAVYRDYIAVSDFIEVMLRLINCGGTDGEILNVCCSQGTSISQLISSFEKIAGYDISITQAPEFTRTNEIWRLIGSNEKLKARLDIPKLSFDIEAVAGEMFEYYRNSQ